MSGGFITLHRRILEWEWYSDANTCRLFFHLLLSANHKDKKWQGKEIKRGQLVTGLHSLSEQTGLSIQQIRTSMNRLKSTGEITSKATNKFSLVTVVKYNSYQDKEGLDNKQNNKLGNKRTTNEQQSTNNQSTTTNNDNNGNNVNKKVIKAKKAKAFTPPTIEEVIEYSKSRNKLYLAKPFFDFFDAGKWKDSHNNQVNNWKQKFISWENRDRKNESNQSANSRPKSNHARVLEEIHAGCQI